MLKGLATAYRPRLRISALVADLELTGIERGEACERFTRDGPLALLPLPARGACRRRAHGAGLVHDRRAGRSERLSPMQNFSTRLTARLGERTLRVVALGTRARYPLHQQARNALVEHRIVYLGNAAQTLHPVAGQGLNLGLRDGAVLAEKIGAACCERPMDPVHALQSYAQSRHADRAAIVALTRTAPGFFSTHFAPIALARSMGLAALAVVPNLRREFARLLMFGVRF